MPSVCYIPIYYMQNCVYLYLVPLLLHRIDNLSADRVALCVASDSKLSRTRSADASTGDSKSLGRRIESAIAKF